RQVGMRGEEASQVRFRQAAEGGLPGVRVALELLGDLRKARGLVLQLGEGARAEDAERLPDAIEETDLRLPDRRVAPRVAQERVDVGRGRLARGLGGATQK